MVDLKARAPVLLSILTAAASQRVSNATDSPPSGIIGMAAAILLKSHLKNICRLQAIICALFYAGHASKHVCNIVSLIMANTCKSSNGEFPFTIAGGVTLGLDLLLLICGGDPSTASQTVYDRGDRLQFQC